MDWSIVGDFPLLKSATDSYMAGDSTQEMLLRNVIVTQRIFRRAVVKIKNIV